MRCFQFGHSLTSKMFQVGVRTTNAGHWKLRKMNWTGIKKMKTSDTGHWKLDGISLWGNLQSDGFMTHPRRLFCGEILLTSTLNPQQVNFKLAFQNPSSRLKVVSQFGWDFNLKSGKKNSHSLSAGGNLYSLVLCTYFACLKLKRDLKSEVCTFSSVIFVSFHRLFCILFS